MLEDMKYDFDKMSLDQFMEFFGREEEFQAHADVSTETATHRRIASHRHIAIDIAIEIKRH